MDSAVSQESTMIFWIAEYNCSLLPKSAVYINLKTVGYVLGKDRISALRVLPRSLPGDETDQRDDSDV